MLRHSVAQEEKMAPSTRNTSRVQEKLTTEFHRTEAQQVHDKTQHFRNILAHLHDIMHHLCKGGVDELVSNATRKMSGQKQQAKPPY